MFGSEGHRLSFGHAELEPMIIFKIMYLTGWSFSLEIPLGMCDSLKEMILKFVRSSPKTHGL